VPNYFAPPGDLDQPPFRPAAPSASPDSSPRTEPGIIGRAPADPAETSADLNAFTAQMRAAEPAVLGFPGNLAFDLDAPEVSALLSVFANNVGDPQSNDSSNVSAKAFERQVLTFFAELAGTGPEEVYGYITSGGSESNLHALHTARSGLPDATVYLSAAAHESVLRAAEVLRMPAVVVPTRDTDDSMDPKALHELASRRRGGAVVVATIGTTMVGDVDDVPALRRAAAVAGLVHVHADAALAGMVLPFAAQPSPAWSFAAGADSVAISGHKMLGLPMAASVVLERAELVRDRPGGQYTGARNRTMGTSRSGLVAAVMWYRLRTLGLDGLHSQVEQALAGAAYAAGRLTAAGLRVRWKAHSPIVAFTLPGPAADFAEVLSRWHLPVEARTDGVLTHVITMPHVTRTAIDSLVADLAAVGGTGRSETAARRAKAGAGR
jgi:histidine decarboxylase